MKRLLPLLILTGFTACRPHTGKMHTLKARVDSLGRRLADAYKPGFGEFMSAVQAHHAKLWFAGRNRNWKLAAFEIHEIREAIDAIAKYEPERSESREAGMIVPALDSMNAAVEKEDTALFRSRYSLLTKTCNDCHRSTNFAFNVVKIPDAQTFSNQDFSIHP